VGDAIGQTLPMAIAVALSPLPIIAVILMLVTPRARTNGPLFVVGCLIGLTVVGAIVLVAAGRNAGEDGAPATWVSVLKIVLGAFLLLIAVQQWRARPDEDDEAETPKWMDAIDSRSRPRRRPVPASCCRARTRRTSCSRSAAPRPSRRPAFPVANRRSRTACSR
jgi:hypothetical protein